MASEEQLRVFNEMRAYGSSPRGRSVLGAHGMLVEISSDEGEPFRLTLHGDDFECRDGKLSKLKISLKRPILLDISEGKLSLQEAQALGLVKLEGAVGLARIFQKATQWGLVRKR